VNEGLAKATVLGARWLGGAGVIFSEVHEGSHSKFGSLLSCCTLKHTQIIYGTTYEIRNKALHYQSTLTL
jgi:hypothetical protein